jgi:hypothetical protein
MKNNLKGTIMKKLTLTLVSVMILGAVAVFAQDQPGSMKQMKDTTHMKSKKPAAKKSTGTYQMKKKSVMPKNEQMEDTSKIKSKSKPVYKK